MVGDLVRDGAEQEPVGARHALVADDDEVGAALLGDVEQGGRRVALAGVGRDLDARRRDLLGRLAQRPLDVVAGADAPPLGPLPGTGSYALTSSIRAPTVAASRVAWRTASRAVSDPSVPTTMAEYIRAASYGDA